MAFECGEVLDEGPALLHVKDLKAPANAEDRDIACNGGGDCGTFGGVELWIGLFGFGCGGLSVEGGLYVGATHQQKPVDTVERGGGRVVGGNEDGVESGGVEGCRVRFGFAEFAVDSEDSGHVRK
jgi:hypothetical protein